MLGLTAGIEPLHQLDLGSGVLRDDDVVNPLDRLQLPIVFPLQLPLEFPPFPAPVPQPGLSFREKTGIQFRLLDFPFGKGVEKPFGMPPVRHRIELGAHQIDIDGILDSRDEDGRADPGVIPGYEQLVFRLQLFQFLFEMMPILTNVLHRTLRLKEIVLRFFPPHPNSILVLQAKTVDVFNVGIEELFLGDDVIVHRAMISQIRRTVSSARS